MRHWTAQTIGVDITRTVSCRTAEELGLGNQASPQIDVAGATSGIGTRATAAANNGAVQNLSRTAVELHTRAAVHGVNDGATTEPVVAVAGFVGGGGKSIGFVKDKDWKILVFVVSKK